MYESDADRRYRGELLRCLHERGICLETIYRLVTPMRGRTDEEKEQIARELIPLVNSGIYDNNPKVFYGKYILQEELDKIDLDKLGIETVKPIVEHGLAMIGLDPESIQTITADFITDDHTRLMFNWIMEQRYVPDREACVTIARNIVSGDYVDAWSRGPIVKKIDIAE